MKKVLIIIIAVFTVSLLQGQPEDENPFDDGGLSDVKWVVKTSPIMFINGDFPLLVERHLFGRFSAEVGAGFLGGYYFPAMIDGLENIENFGKTEFFDSPSPGVEDISGGYSLHSALKVYFSQSSNLEGSSVGLAFRQRTYNFDSWDENVISSDVYILSSAQVNMTDRLFLEGYIGLGATFRTISDGSENFEFFTALIPIGVKIGFGL